MKIFETDEMSELLREYSKNNNWFFNEKEKTLETTKERVNITIVPIENDTKLSVYLAAFSSNKPEIEEESLHTFAAAQLYLKQKYNFKKMPVEDRFKDSNYAAIVRLKYDHVLGENFDACATLDCFVHNVCKSIRYSYLPESKKQANLIKRIMHPELFEE